MNPTTRAAVLGLVGLGVIGGKGCGSCIWTERMVNEVVAEAHADVQVEKVTKVSEMVSYGILSTPAVVIDDRGVHVGGIPSKEDVRRWVQELKA